MRAKIRDETNPTIISMHMKNTFLIFSNFLLQKSWITRETWEWLMTILTNEKYIKNFTPIPRICISTHHSWICYMVLRILYLKFATHKIPHIYVLYLPYTYTYTHIVEIFTDSASYCIPKSKRARITGKWNWEMMKNSSLHFVYKKERNVWRIKRIHWIQTAANVCAVYTFLSEWIIILC